MNINLKSNQTVIESEGVWHVKAGDDRGHGPDGRGQRHARAGLPKPSTIHYTLKSKAVNHTP